MITGSVDDDLNAVIEITVTGIGLRRKNIAAKVDTGFNDYLLLPNDVIAFLKLERTQRDALATLADGTEIATPYFIAEVLWDGAMKRVLVLGTEGGALVGMSLMRGYDLSVAVTEGGAVTLSKTVGETLSA
ncbi:MAG: clan AA aspartic protease [Armatimonadetes bacterium]|nr:clan AA aspartic protease [Armatimonadota bacterium]